MEDWSRLKLEMRLAARCHDQEKKKERNKVKNCGHYSSVRLTQEKIAAKTLLTAKNDSRIGVLPPVTTLRWGLGMAAFAAAAGGEAGAGEKQRGVTMELASGAAVPV